MNGLKDLICKQYIDLDVIKPVISKKNFKKYVGVSIDTFEGKLGKIDGVIDQNAFKFQEPILNTSTQKWLVRSGINNKQPDQILFGHYSNPQPTSYWGKISKEEALSSFSYENLPVFLSQPEYDSTLFELLSETEPQNDNPFIRSLKEQYGDNWEVIYEKLMGFKRVFRILLTIEYLLFDGQNDKYHNSPSRLYEFEYFDLMFTVKKWKNSELTSEVNFPFYSPITSFQNEKKGFS